MDGNSTMSLGQFLSGYSEIFLPCILVILTGVLAYYTKNLYHATSKYVGLVGSQNKIMEKQNEMMDENRKHELLVKKYNRMLDEMKYLVAPLYARRNDPQIFTLREFDSKIKYANLYSSIGEDPINREFYEFWENVYRNLYLNQSSSLLRHFNKYSQSILNFYKFEAENSEFRGLYGSGYSDETLNEKQKMISDEFEFNREIFINIIEHRYNKLSIQISMIEKDLNISASSLQVSNPRHENT